MYIGKELNMSNEKSYIRHQASRTSHPTSTERILATTPYTVVEYMAQVIVKVHKLPKSKVLQIIKLSTVPDDFNTVQISNAVSKLDSIIAKEPVVREQWCKQVSDDLLQGTRNYVNPAQIHVYVLASQLQHNLDIKDTGLVDLSRTITYFRKDLRGTKLQFVNGKDIKHCQILLGLSETDWGIQGYSLLTPESREWNMYSRTVSQYTYSVFSLDLKTTQVELLTRKLKVKETGELLKASFNIRESSIVSVN